MPKITMLSDNSITEIEAIIGYTFKSKLLLEVAFTHSSYVNEHEAFPNERLEFLGDSILNFIVADVLFRASKEDEGSLTARRQGFVSREPLNDAVERMNIMRYYQIGKGISRDNHLSSKFKSNLFEALLGAIYIDSNNLTVCKKFVDKFLLRCGEIQSEKDAKSKLQEYLQGRGIKWQYQTKEMDGKIFECVLSVDGQAFLGNGRKKRDAEQDAAKSALLHFGV